MFVIELLKVTMFYLSLKLVYLSHPPLFFSSHFREIVVNFYAVLSKRGRFSKAPSLKTSRYPAGYDQLFISALLFSFFIRRSKKAAIVQRT